MRYHKIITLKDGRTCTLRNGTAEDGQALLDIFNLTHAQTDYLLTYPEEHSYTAEDEAELLRRKTDSADEIELLVELDGKVIGSAGIGCVARKEKTRHRAELGISVDKAHWGLGIGRALTEGCIECARTAGYGEQKRPRPVQERGLCGVRQEPKGLPLPPDRLAGAGAHAAGAGMAKRYVRGTRTAFPFGGRKNEIEICLHYPA